MGSDKEAVTAEIVKAFHASIRLQCSVLQRWVDAGIMNKDRAAEELRRAAQFLTDSA